MKEDARVIRTKKDLRNGMLRLLRKERFEQITVKEICAETSINKMTFYKHYDDKYDLLDDCVKALASEIWLSAMEERQIPPTKEGWPSFLAELTTASINQCIRYKEEILSIGFSSTMLGSEVLRSAIEKRIDSFVTMLSTQFDFKYEHGALLVFLSGGYTNIVLRILHEGTYDEALYRNRIEEVFRFVLFSNVLKSQ